MRFNEFVKLKRVENKISLRQFCRKTGYDPSNWSKIERGLLLPPKDPKTLETIATALGFKPGEDNFSTLFELASIAAIPDDIIDKKTLDKLPLFFRTVRGDKPSEEELRNLINTIKQTK